jgi:hypothetical protein
VRVYEGDLGISAAAKKRLGGTLPRAAASSNDDEVKFASRIVDGPRLASSARNLTAFLLMNRDEGVR